MMIRQTLGITAAAATALAVLASAPADGLTEDTPEDLEDALREALCQDREPCHLETRFDAGTDEEGRQLYVQKLRLSEQQESKPLPVDECVPREWWMARMKKSKVPKKVDARQYLVEICNTGYGAAGVGADDVTVEPNTFTHTRRGGSAWRWSISHTIQLSPLRVLREHYSGYWTLGPNRSKRVFDWTSHRGRTNWFAPACGDDGGLGPRPGPTRTEEAAQYAFEPIPRTETEEGFRKKGWKNTALGSCAVHLDSRGNQTPESFGRGFVIHGDPSPADRADDASMRAVFGSPTTLFVEVDDDAWVEGTDKWILSDHVEIWVGEDYGYMDHCLPEKTDPKQWGIGLDGTVYPADGKPQKDALEVEVVDGRKKKDSGGKTGSVRLKIEFEETPEAITLVYSDSDDGDSQKRLIANSKLEFGEAPTLGRIATIKAGAGACNIEDGTLNFKAKQDHQPDKPIVD